MMRNVNRSENAREEGNMDNRLQIYSSVVSSVLALIVYFAICFLFTKIDLLEMVVTFICFVLPIMVAIPYYISEK